MQRDATMSGSECGPPQEVEDRKVWSYIWLAYSGFYFIEPVLRRDLRFWIETICIYALFLAIYIAVAKVESRRTRFILVGAMFVLGALDYPRNQGASSFFIYVAGFLAFMIEPVAWFALALLIDCLVLFGEGLWLMRHPVPGEYLSSAINLSISVFFVLVVGVSNRVVAQQKRADSRLRRAEREILQLAAVAERERIARDLHDVLGHTLSVIVLKAELAGRLVERDPARAVAEIADVEQTARVALREVREAIGGYRSQGLAAELGVARRALDAAGVVLTLEEIDALTSVTTIDPEVQTMFSLTLREAVTNIVRHAGATHCRVSFTTRGGRHALLIEDDGTHAAQHEGNGLRGMRERVQRMGGQFSLQTSGGTRVLVEVPVAKA